MDQLQTVNQVVEALNSSERMQLLYLCGSFETDPSAESLKELLGRKVLHRDTGQMLLRELVVRLRRFDILRKVCKTSRDEVEKSLSVSHFVPTFRVLMTNISEDLASEELKNLKFLLSEDLPREKLENSKTFLDVVFELEKLDKVSSQSVDLMEACLADIGRLDLTRKVSAYRKSAAALEQNPQQQRSRTGPSLAASSPHQATGQGQAFHKAEKGNFKYTESIPTSASRDQSCQLESYRFSSNPRGGCLIIDCVGDSGDLLEQTFKVLNFRVVVHRWLTAQGILTTLKEVITQTEYTEGDAFVCCIVSRGTSNHLLGTDSCITGLPLDSINRQFTANGCPTLAGKPKLLFIQRYSVAECQPHDRRYQRDEDLETDGLHGDAAGDAIPENADIFWSHCWTDESQLEQGPHYSTYLKAVTRTLLEGQRRRKHITDLHTEVNGAIFEHNNRNPGAPYSIELKHTLRKNLYL